MTYSRTTPALLAEAMLANLSKNVLYPAIPTDGAGVAARFIADVVAPARPRTPVAIGRNGVLAPASMSKPRQPSD